MINRAQALSTAHMADKALDSFINMLSNFVFIDVGTISTLHEDGYVDVITGRVIGNNVVTYTHVELLAPGTSVGTYSSPPTNGTLCLLFSPRSVVPDTRTMALARGKNIYSIVGMKALMVAHPSAENVQAGFSGTGNFIISGPDYGASLVVTPEGNLIIQGENYQMTVTSDGQRTTQWRYRTCITINDGSETETWYNSDYYKIRERIHDAGGTITTTLYDGSEDEKPVKVVEEVSDGTTTTTYYDGDDVLRTVIDNAQGSMELEIGSGPEVTITIDADNGIQISTTQNISVQCDGDATIEAGGNCDITATQSATIDSPSVTITGGQLSVGGLASASGSGPFCGIPSCLFTGAPHVGDTVSGT